MNQHSKQHGLTLIELLVAITIGLFIIGAALMVFQSVGSVGRQVNEVTQLQQQGATAFRLIGKQIREAGDLQPTYVAAIEKYQFNPSYNWAGQATSVAAWGSPPSGVTKYVNLVQQIPSAATAPYLKNCIGNNVTAGNRRSTFFLKDNKLMCATETSTGGQPIINNVNDMVVRYRVQQSPTQRRFFNAGEAFNWNRVDAIEICLDLIGTKVTPDGGNQYENCDGDLVDRNQRVHFVQKSLFKINPGS